MKQTKTIRACEIDFLFSVEAEGVEPTLTLDATPVGEDTSLIRLEIQESGA